MKSFNYMNFIIKYIIDDDNVTISKHLGVNEMN